jgi:peroxiredoxin
MPALAPGAVAPEIALTDLDGRSTTLADALKTGPAIVVFFKISCPTCQFTLPFLQRLYDAYRASNLTFLGISQDASSDTRAFMAEFGLRFRVLIDDRGYPASKAYGLTNVPTVFWIDPEARIRIASVGFSKVDLEKISAHAALAAGMEAQSPFRSGERVPEFKPG